MVRRPSATAVLIVVLLTACSGRSSVDRSSGPGASGRPLTDHATPAGPANSSSDSPSSETPSHGDSQTPAPELGAGEYRNPVFEPVFADPSVIQAKDGWLYAFGTEDDWGDGEGRRAIPMLRSQDLVEWTYIGEAFAEGRRPDWKSAYLWAPDINQVGDQYVLYYSLSLWGDHNPGIGVATSDAPEGPYEDHGKLFDSEQIGVENSIDPMLFQAEEAPYFFWGSFNGIYGIEMAADGLSTVGEKFMIAGDAYEAPYIVKRDGAFWFFGSTGSCCEGERSTYAVAVGRADRLKGPYFDRDGTELMNGGRTQILHGADAFVGPGHVAVIQDEAGTDWLVYHAIDPDQPTAMSGAPRRPLMIDPIDWQGGWPSIHAGTPSDDVRDAPMFSAPGRQEATEVGA